MLCLRLRRDPAVWQNQLNLHADSGVYYPRTVLDLWAPLPEETQSGLSCVLFMRVDNSFVPESGAEALPLHPVGSDRAVVY